MSFLTEFKQFALKGNAMDLAIGVIIGAAFGSIVNSLVNDIMMPLISKCLGGFDFSNLYIPLAAIPAGMANTYASLKAAGIPMLAYGNFITIVINFIILALVIFIMVKQMNRLIKSEPKKESPPIAEEILLLREIRDALSKNP